MMDFNQKRTLDLAPEGIQQGSRSWWTDNPMSYDWKNENSEDKLSLRWFNRADASFIHGARLFATDKIPFDRIIPYPSLQGKRVLEIGCGLGLHTELMTRAGAEVTAVDMTSTSIDATRTRLRLKGLAATVAEADAERLPFPEHSFDFVWSWGVIHHSARTGRIVREIARVLKEDGQCRVMVYNRGGMPSRVIFVKDFVLRLKWRKQSFDETLYRATDGFSARYYCRDQFEDLFRTFFSEVSSTVCGQDADVVPLPRYLRKLALHLTPEAYLQRAQAKRGGFIFLAARKPE